MSSVIPASFVASGFTETYNRSDREIVGDNGWYATHSLPSTGQQAIVSNRLRAVAGTTGFPGSSGTIGNPICHDVVHGNSDVVDVAFDIMAGAITIGNGSTLYMICGCTTTGSPATINSGVLLRWQLDTQANNILIQKITASNSTADHSPGTFPACPANATTTVRCRLTRSTGVLTVAINGTTQYTSASGNFSSLTGSTLGFQMQSAYSTTPYELDNVIAV